LCVKIVGWLSGSEQSKRISTQKSMSRSNGEFCIWLHIKISLECAIREGAENPNSLSRWVNFGEYFMVWDSALCIQATCSRRISTGTAMYEVRVCFFPEQSNKIPLRNHWADFQIEWILQHQLSLLFPQ
jgi:hypothetical protein